MALELNRKNEKKLSIKDGIKILKMTPEERASAGIYIKNEVGNRKLQTTDGKYFGDISYDAYKAIENGTLDRYKPLRSEEKILSEYRKYPSVPLAVEGGKSFGNVSYDAYDAIIKNKIDEYTPYSEDEKKVLDNYKKWTGYGKTYKGVEKQYSESKIAQGNIDLTTRPIYINEKGQLETIGSIIINEGGKEVVIPTIIKDKNGKAKKLSDNEAIEHYRKTGEYLGKFNTKEEAEWYAQNLNVEQNIFYSTKLEDVTEDEYNVLKKYGFNPVTFSDNDFKAWAEKHNFEYRIVYSDYKPDEYKWMPKNTGGLFWKNLTTDEEEKDKEILERFLEKQEKKEYAEEHPWLASVETIAQAPIRGIAGLGAVIEDSARSALGKEIDTYDNAHYIVEDTDIIRGTVTDEYASKWFGGASGKLGNYGALTYNNLMSLGDMVVNSLALKGIGTVLGLTGTALTKFIANTTSALLASNSASSTIMQKKKEGLSDGKAVLVGLSTGAAEFITEKYSLEAIFKTPSSMLKKGLVSFIAEFSEEEASDVLSKLADYVIAGDDSTIKKNISQYMQSGMSKKEATKQAVKDSAWETFSAGLSGGFSGVALSSAYHGFGKSEIKKVGADYRIVASDVIQQGLDSPENTIAYKNAKKLSEKGVENISDYELGKQHIYNIEQIDYENELAEKKTKKTKATRSGNIEGKKQNKITDVRAVMTTGATEDTIERVINGGNVLEANLGEASAPVTAQEQMQKSNNYSGMGGWVYSSIERETGKMTDIQKKAFEYLYNFGKGGASLSEAVALIKDNPVLSKAFDETQMRRAWNAGKTDGQVLKNGGVLKNGNHRKIDGEVLGSLEKLGKLFGVAIELEDIVYSEDGKEVNGVYSGGRRIKVSLTADNKLLVVAGHEILHYMKAQSLDAYLEYEKAALNTIAKENGISVDDLISSYEKALREQGFNLDEAGVKEEIVADFTGSIIGDEAKLSEFMKNVSKSETVNKGKIKTAFEKIREALKDICSIFKNEKGGAEFEKAYKLLENLAIETKGKTDGEVKATEQKNSIKHLSKGRKYVQADEQVIHSTDDNVRAYEIMGYIKNKILKGSKEVVVTLDNGEQIKITGRTAWKMAGKDKFNDKYYLVKGNASGVIDEIIATSKYDGWKKSYKEHSDGFAKKGFDYRKAYFRDLDGKYYELDISVGINEDGKEAYNIGQIKEIPFPSDKSVNGSKAQKEKVSPDPNISQDKSDVNTYSTQKGGKNSVKDSEYLELAKNPVKNEAKLREMVREKAVESGAILDEDGNPLMLYRGTIGGQTVFAKDMLHRGIVFTTDNIDIATRYGDKTGKATNISNQVKDEPTTYALYGFPTKMLTIDAQYGVWSDLVVPDELLKYSEGKYKATNADISKWAGMEGYDAVRIKNVRDGGGFIFGDQIMFFDSNKVKSADLVTYDDTGDIIPLSQRFNEKNDDIRYSAKGDILNTVLENKKLKSENERLRREFEKTAFSVPDGNSIKNYAKEIKSVFSSKLSRVEIEAMVTELYDLMANGADYLQVQDKANEIAEKIIESSEIRNDTNYNRYKSLRDDLRKIGFTLDETQRAEFAPGELEDIRKRNMGRFLIRKEGVNLDTKYAELSNDYPEFFDYETENSTPLRLQKIAEVIDSLAIVYENPFDGMMGETKASLSNQLIDDIIKYSPTGKPTFADKMEAKLTLAEKKRVEDIQKTIESERTKREKAVERIRKQYEDKISKTDERRKKALILNQIRNQAEKLSKRLHTANSKSHIKEHLIPAVEDFLGVCDFNLGTDPEIRDTKTIPAKKFLEKFEGVGNVFSDGADITDGEFTYIDKDISAKLKNIVEERGEDVTIKDLTAYELDVFRSAVMNVVHIANTENRAFSAEINDTVTMLGNSVISENGGFYEGGEEIKLEGLKKVGNYFLGWDQYRAGTAFHLMGPTMEKLYKALRNGFDLKAQYLEESSNYIKNKAKENKIDLKELYNSEPIVFKTAKGRTIKITKAQIMSLYLTQRQNAGKKHLLDKNGGMVIEEISKTNKRQNKIEITQKDIERIIGKLSKNEVAFAESISDFFKKDVAKWANEASMKLYGYEKFGTKDYFPLFIEKVSAQEKSRVNSELKKQAKLENVSFSKLREQEASGAVIIKNILDIYVNYTDKMTSYSSFTVPLADMQRVLGYTDGKYSVENALDGKSKGEALKYLYKFTDDLNGNVISGSGGGGFDTLMRNYKTAAIGFKLSVALKQPTAYLRAVAVMDSKYLLGAMKEGRVDKEIIHKYAPISFWKENGFFSINANRSMKNVIIGNTSLKEGVTEASMFLAGKADEVTWGRLWKACELEIKDKHPELRAGTDAFYKEVGKRFSEVVDETQVVDSVFHRNQMMRDTSWTSKYLTMFRSEPSLTYNLLVKTFNDFKQDKKANAVKLEKAIFGAVFSTIAASAVGALISATRSSLTDFITDDDDEEEFGEAFFDNLISTAGGDLTSILTGFDLAFDLLSGSSSGSFSSATARPELAGIEKFIRSAAKAIEAFSKDGEETIPYAMTNMIRDGASALGIPVDGFKQALNIGLGVWKNLGLPRGGADARYKALSLLYRKGGNDFKNGLADMMFDAYVSGDKAAYKRFMFLAKEDELDTKKITDALKTRLKKHEEENGAFSPSFAVSWNGVRVKLDEIKEETEPTFDDYIAGLSAEDYDDYETTFEETYNRISDEIGEERFEEFSSDEDKHDEYNKLESYIMKYSKEIALNEATGGEYKFSADWIGKAEEVSALVDMSVGEYIYYRAEYGTKLDSNRAMKALKAGYTPEEYMELNDRYNALSGTGKKKRFLDELRGEGFSEREIRTIDYIFTTNTK